MTAILVRCRGCGREVASAECDRDLRCAVCVATGLISLDLQAYQRAWSKRGRYSRARLAVDHIEEQLGRLAKRMSAKLHRGISDVALATETLNAALEQARQRADTADGRILVPRVGQELVGEGARA